MGSVWVARLQGKHGFEKLFAIKTILPQHASNPLFRSMFLDEARVASAIVHPNVGQILDLGEHQGILYLVMEWVEGDSLDRVMRNARKSGGTLPIGFVLRVVADTCLGLHAAHELTDRDGKAYDVVHRDISPQNVLVALNGCPKLIDFGVAKARNRMTGETSGVVVKGKIRYISPQQALGLSVDRRADIWSMGALLYVTMVGDTPYPGDTEVEILRGLMSGAPPKPLPAAIPQAIARVVEKCLKHDAADRYASALDLHLAIEEAMVEASTPYSVAEVAAYMQTHTQHRVESRRLALEAALADISGQIPRPPEMPRKLDETQAEFSLIPIDLASYSEEVTFRRPSQLGRVMVGIGIIAVVTVLLIFLLRFSRDPKVEVAAHNAVVPSASASVLRLAPLVPVVIASVPAVVASSAHIQPRHRPAHPANSARVGIPPASSGLGSAIDSRN